MTPDPRLHQPRLFRRIAAHLLPTLLLVGVASNVYAASNYTVEPDVTYGKGVVTQKTLGTECTWASQLVQSISNRAAKTVDSRSIDTSGPRVVRLKVLRQRIPAPGTKGDVETVIRANIEVSGKTVASQDFSADKTIPASTSACEGLKALNQELAESVDDWVHEAVLPLCGDDCAGIHPDELIYLSSIIGEQDSESVSDKVRNECRWQEYMPTLIAQAYREEEKPSAPPLIVKQGHTKSATGRALVLQVNSIHIAGLGGFTGPKWVYLEGQLFDGNLLAASFKGGKKTMRGSLNACDTLKSLSEDLASDIAEWLHEPKLNAEF